MKLFNVIIKEQNKSYSVYSETKEIAIQKVAEVISTDPKKLIAEDVTEQELETLGKTCPGHRRWELSYFSGELRLSDDFMTIDNMDEVSKIIETYGE